MATLTESSDAALLESIQSAGSMSVAEVSSLLKVTATAVRQRLNRLMAQGLVQRETVHAPARGRPVHRYSLTEKGRRRAGTNFADLAMVLWREIRGIKDAEVRRGLLRRIADGLTESYRRAVGGRTTGEKMEAVSAVFADRMVPVSASHDAATGLPVLTVHECPYPELAREDRGICAVETMMFQDLLGGGVRLAECRLDGHNCCRFETQ
jgi:predicted ArsR family transcriptional regulator